MGVVRQGRYGTAWHCLASAIGLAQPCTVISIVAVVVLLQCRSFGGIGAATVLFRWHRFCNVAILVVFVLLDSLSRFVTIGLPIVAYKLQSWLSCSCIRSVWSAMSVSFRRPTPIVISRSGMAMFFSMTSVRVYDNVRVYDIAHLHDKILVLCDTVPL